MPKTVMINDLVTFFSVEMNYSSIMFLITGNLSISFGYLTVI